jgi:hypothetical protein
MVTTKVFIDISPKKELKVCGNCRHFIKWGVHSGNCWIQHGKDKSEYNSCKKFKK